ncbi:MAG TPA: 5-methyltetrahydropteroyltriglutamate--homocysteine S-methyltransferase [Steroidobacteraceae bacterium]|nr:5-methyltetrahydropteroyltriglutamate--homocysteine S-methyltransferase [Steroidobacteraceae bacterium]
MRAINLGFPRVGVKRELKFAEESYWKGASTREALLATAKELRRRHWQLQSDAGIDGIPCNDFSLYDQMLDMSCLLGCVPQRFGWQADVVDLYTYFAMARGSKTAAAMEMTKWFDTNYHYIVPEFEQGMRFRIGSSKLFDELAEARVLGIEPTPVLIGPVTYLLLGKAKYPGFSLAKTAQQLLPVYGEILQTLANQSVTQVQIDEPCLVTDLSREARELYPLVYRALARAAPSVAIQLTTYFGDLDDNRALAFSLPVSSVHVDLVRAPGQLDASIDAALASHKRLSLGVVDGRNIWRNDLGRSISAVERAAVVLGADRVAVGPSCSLLHSPCDVNEEHAMDPEIRAWLAFATQKLDEIVVVARGAASGRNTIADALRSSDAVQLSRRSSRRIHDAQVANRLASVTPAMLNRARPFAERRRLQASEFKLPLFPTTTIGSFPQTAEIRAARAAFRAGRLEAADYEAAMRREIESVVRFQERVDLDVLVHGEAERNDMVEYFGEQLEGYAFSENGWVQSYGSRCVKPPIIYGDVSRAQAMTVKWSTYAQSLTPRIMKGMLTGPVTILQWSFVRDDQPRWQTCRQIALAIRDEVMDLEAAGIRIIQIDEPAIREGLPLRRTQWPAYLRWAVEAFRLSAAGVRDNTQIHTHMCYSEFNDIMDAVAAMDADVISIETSRSQMELLDAFVTFRYPNEIGPGVYDIHSPRVPSASDMSALLDKARGVLRPEQIWVNPDCGLKTRAWPEVEQALVNMVAVAKTARAEMSSGPIS